MKSLSVAFALLSVVVVSVMAGMFSLNDFSDRNQQVIVYPAIIGGLHYARGGGGGFGPHYKTHFSPFTTSAIFPSVY